MKMKGLLSVAKSYLKCFLVVVFAPNQYVKETNFNFLRSAWPIPVTLEVRILVPYDVIESDSITELVVWIKISKLV
jgi:hypothetical protein